MMKKRTKSESKVTITISGKDADIKEVIKMFSSPDPKHNFYNGTYSCSKGISIVQDEEVDEYQAYLDAFYGKEDKK